MRFLRISLLLTALTLAGGCAWLNGLRPGPDPSPGPKRTTAVEQVTAEQLVGYLNDRASRLQTITYGETRITAREGIIPYPALRGNLAAGQPRNFRLTGQGTMAGKVDLGSNEKQFWAYVEAPTTKPMFVFASHSDFESGRAKVPGGMPFEPDWVMQALGMTTFPRNLHYTASTNTNDRTYTLSWTATTPSGMAIRKEIVFDADEAREGRPQVKKHLIRDGKGPEGKGKLLCSAEVKSAKTIQIGTSDPRTAQVTVQYPTHVVLRWEEQRFEMDLALESAQVNQRLTEEQSRRLFNRPNIPGSEPIDLARYEFPASR